jgi:hypothetical protein
MTRRKIERRVARRYVIIFGEGWIEESEERGKGCSKEKVREIRRMVDACYK